MAIEDLKIKVKLIGVGGYKRILFLGFLARILKIDLVPKVVEEDTNDSGSVFLLTEKVVISNGQDGCIDKLALSRHPAFLTRENAIDYLVKLDWSRLSGRTEITEVKLK